jgi:hypothetical protein
LKIDLEYPDFLEALERLGIVESDGSTFDGGAPGGNVYSLKVHINVAIYEQMVAELWVFRDRLVAGVRLGLQDQAAVPLR